MKGGISVNAAVINKNAKLQRVPEACADTNWSTRMSDLPIEPEIGDVYKVSGKTVFFDGCWNEIASAE